jgi:hypothetical protein
MTTPLPDSLVRFGEQLERAIERERRLGRHGRRIAFRVIAATTVAVAAGLGVTALPDDKTVVAPPGVATASAAERAAAVLSAAPGSIVHEIASYRQTGPGGVSSWREETWRQTSSPYARRELTTPPTPVRNETATAGDRPAQLYEPATDSIYTNPPETAPALGTPMPATDGDPLAEQMAHFLRSGDAHAVSRSSADGRAVIRFAYTNPLPEGGAVKWSYVVDADSYRPLRLTATSPDGSRVETDFDAYQALEPTETTKALLSLNAQHPDATVDRTEAGYMAAQARLYSQPPRRAR